MIQTVFNKFLSATVFKWFLSVLILALVTFNSAAKTLQIDLWEISVTDPSETNDSKDTEGEKEEKKNLDSEFEENSFTLFRFPVAVSHSLISSSDAKLYYKLHGPGIPTPPPEIKA